MNQYEYNARFRWLVGMTPLIGRASLCKRHGVGVIAIDVTLRGSMLCAWNEQPSGRRPDQCTGEVGACGCLHAEDILTCSRLPAESRIAVFLSLAPCPTCVGLLALWQTRALVYREPCRHEGIDQLLEGHGIKSIGWNKATREEQAAFIQSAYALAYLVPSIGIRSNDHEDDGA